MEETQPKQGAVAPVVAHAVCPIEKEFIKLKNDFAELKKGFDSLIHDLQTHLGTFGGK